MGRCGVLFMRLILVLIWAGVLMASPSEKFLNLDPCAKPGATQPGCLLQDGARIGPPANKYTRPCTKANGCQRNVH
ncbi:hypothetical protein AMTRI_Chr02g265390 [Amborella trichopoda]|uniref:Uncharacterized protein n=1 Tax=Amborella trichopoda TaxID=13333 RepID=W1P2S4_AMBTC|nr:hypothetical protein AMTR_s00045p00207290 [Amborella trichopoda]